MPTNPTWDETEDISAAPTWDNTIAEGEPERTNRFGETRADLERQMREARAEGIGDKAILGLADLGERAAYTLADALGRADVTGLTSNILARQGVQRTPTLLQPEDVGTVGQFISEGLHLPTTAPVEASQGVVPDILKGAKEFGTEMAVGLSDPGMIAMGGAASKIPREMGRLFQLQMAAGLPQGLQDVAAAETLPEAVKSGLGVAANVAFPAMIEKGLQPKLKPVPDIPGRAIKMPEGAKPVEPKVEVAEPKPEELAPVKVNLPEEIKVETKPEVAVEPTLPETNPEPTPAPQTIQDAWTAFDDTGTVGSARELADVIDGLIASGSKIPASVKRALAKYRKAVKEDFESHAGRGDVEPFEEKFIAEVEKAAGKQGKVEPEATTTSTESVPLGVTAIQQAKSIPELTEAVGKLYLQATTKEQHAQLKQAHDIRAAELQPTPAPAPVEGKGENIKAIRFVQTAPGAFKDQVLVTPSAKQAGKWQATLLIEEENGQLIPKGDAVFNTREEAIRSAQGETVNGIPGAGSKTFKPIEEAEPTPTAEPAKAQAQPPAVTEAKLSGMGGVSLYHGSHRADLTSLKPSKYGDFGKGVYLSTDPAFSKQFAESTAYGDLSPEQRAARGKGRVYDVDLIEQPKKIFTEDETLLTPEELAWWRNSEYGIENDVTTRSQLFDERSGRNYGSFEKNDHIGNSEEWDAFLDKFGYDAVKSGSELVIRDPKLVKIKPTPTAQTVAEPKKGQIQGMGGAIPEEFQKGQGSPTAMKYRLIDEERRKRGLEPLTTIGKRSDQAMMDRAMAEMDNNPAAPEVLVEELLKKPRPIEDWENHMLLLRKIGLREEYYKAVREAAQAYEDSVQFPERLSDMEAANARANWYSEHLDKLEQASRYSGSMRGAALRALRVMANEDYSLASLKAQARQNRDWEVLTPEKEAKENADLLKIADEHKAKAEELQKKLDELEKKQQNENLADIVVKLKGESARTPKGATTTVGTLTDKIRAKYEKNPKADIRFFVRKLARQFVAEGTKDRDVLVDQVHGVLSQIIPDLERRNTMDLISGYGDYSRLPKDTVSVILRDLSGQMQQIAKLEDMLGGDAPLRSGQERRTPSDAERLLQKQVEEQKKKGGYTVTDPETQLRTAQEAIQKRLENQIKDLELQIQTRQKIIKNPTKLQYDAKSNQLKARRDELKAVYDEIFAKPPKTEAERLAAWKERTKDRMEELKDFIAGTKQPKPKTTPVVLDKEALRIRFDLHTIERLWREKLAKEKRDQWTKWQKTRVIPGEVLNVSRALLTSFDFSAPGRQGAIIGLAHPVRAAKALKPMFEAWRSEKGAFDAAEQIRNRENAPLYEIGKLYLAEHGGRLSKQEEAYMSRWASKIPGIRASERAYTTFLNRLRADSFDSMVNGLTAKGTASPAELQAIANFINVATGRGVGLEKSGTTLNTVFFAPRYVASRFQFLAGQPMYKGTAATRKMIAKEYAKFFAGAAVVYGLAQAAGATVGTDPRSSDFGKIIIGKTRIDPMAGLNQVITLVGRTVTGENKPIKGKAYPIVGKVPYGKSNLLDIWANFFRSKLSPGLGTAVSLRYGKDVAGQPFDVSNLPVTMAVPISWQDMFSAMREEGVPAGIALGLLSMFGAGVNTFENQVKR